MQEICLYDLGSNRDGAGDGSRHQLPGDIGIVICCHALYARRMVRYLVFVLMVIGAGCLFGQDQTPSKPKQFIC
ncbi:MAG TPA: hypothetical protein VHY59_08250, partial [Chthoniobacterales bacterium]|nr:hypothetical protein [Chthoniobacterales bacterium]